VGSGGDSIAFPSSRLGKQPKYIFAPACVLLEGLRTAGAASPSSNAEILQTCAVCDSNHKIDMVNIYILTRLHALSLKQVCLNAGQASRGHP